MIRHARVIRPGHVVGVVVAGCMVGTMLWLLAGVTDSRDEDRQPATAVPTEPVEDPISSDPLNPAPEQSDPPELMSTKEEIRNAVKRFVAVYYGRTPAMYEGDEQAAQSRFERRLRPLVTPDFMKSSGAPVLVDDAVAAQAIGGKRFDAVVMKKSVSGHFYDEVTVDQVMTVMKRDVSGPEPRPVDFISLDIELVLTDTGWLVAVLEERTMM